MSPEPPPGELPSPAPVSPAPVLPALVLPAPVLPEAASGELPSPELGLPSPAPVSPSPEAGRPTVLEVLGTSAGGVGVHVRSLVAHLVAAGWPVTVAAPVSTQAVFDFAADGATIATVPIRGAGQEALAVPALRRAQRGAGIVHAHGLRAGMVAVLARRVPRGWPRPGRGVRPAPPPLVITWHNAVLATGLAGRLLALGERLVARGADVSLGASPDLVARIRALGGRDVRLAPVAPPSPVPVRDAAAVRAEFAVPAGAALVVCVARLHPQKGLDVLVAAVARFATGNPTGRATAGATVVIAGDGPLRRQLQHQIDDLGAPVHLAGRRHDVADLLAAADLVVLASRWEARPLVAQEAMRLGRALVATDVGGVRDLVGDGARLVRADDVDALSAAMLDLLADDAARAALGSRAADVAAGWPSEAMTNRAVEDVYRELLGVPRFSDPADGPELLG